MEQEQPTIGQVLAKYRNGRGFSQEDLAEKTGLSRGSIAQIETGVIKWPRPDTLQTLTTALGVPLSQVFREAGILPQEEVPVSRELMNLTHAIPELNELIELAKQHPEQMPMILRLVRCLLEK